MSRRSRSLQADSYITTYIAPNDIILKMTRFHFQSSISTNHYLAKQSSNNTCLSSIETENIATKNSRNDTRMSGDIYQVCSKMYRCKHSTCPVVFVAQCVYFSLCHPALPMLVLTLPVILIWTRRHSSGIHSAQFLTVSHCIGGFKVGVGDTCPPMAQNFLNFRKFGNFVCWCPPGWLAPPPMGNPGSAPA